MGRGGDVRRHGRTAGGPGLRRPGGREPSWRHAARIAGGAWREAGSTGRHAAAHAGRAPYAAAIGWSRAVRPRSHTWGHRGSGWRSHGPEEHPSTHHAPADVHRDLNAHLALLCVEEQVEAGSSHSGELAHDDVLGYAAHGVDLRVGGGLHEDVNCFLEGTSHQGSGVLPVDSVTRDCHEMTLGRHDVTQETEVPVVYVQAVEGQHR